MSRTFQYTSKYESGAEVMKLGETLFKHSLVDCDLCHQEVEVGETKEMEFENQFLDFVCNDCFSNPPEEYPQDEDQYRGDR